MPTVNIGFHRSMEMEGSLREVIYCLLRQGLDHFLLKEIILFEFQKLGESHLLVKNQSILIVSLEEQYFKQMDPDI